MIRFQQVVKMYGGRAVLDNVSLTIEAGEFVSIVGRSGAGKTTLAKLILGVEKTDLGVVSVDGLIVTEMRPGTLQKFRRKVGMVFQDYRLLPEKTVFENVAFALEVTDVPEATIQSQVDEVLAKLELSHIRDAFPLTLSGGEQQRVAIARALVHRPRLLIADEPTGNLDPEGTDTILNLLRQIHGQGTTVILTTHDPEVVNFFQERVIFLEDGKVKSDLPQARYPGR
ncbi:MAG: ATP-binding cassette domain-containing protein [Candidatus Abawacabacteria bacterium]|nr:ATP-binding cassette domain-containing protein [Candidatus Abawacabacteria bacterium]